MEFDENIIMIYSMRITAGRSEARHHPPPFQQKKIILNIRGVIKIENNNNNINNKRTLTKRYR
jgi:hypothetical protein